MALAAPSLNRVFVIKFAFYNFVKLAHLYWPYGIFIRIGFVCIRFALELNRLHYFCVFQFYLHINKLKRKSSSHLVDDR